MSKTHAKNGATDHKIGRWFYCVRARGDPKSKRQMLQFRDNATVVW